MMQTGLFTDIIETTPIYTTTPTFTTTPLFETTPLQIVGQGVVVTINNVEYSYGETAQVKTGDKIKVFGFYFTESGVRTNISDVTSLITKNYSFGSISRDGFITLTQSGKTVKFTIPYGGGSYPYIYLSLTGSVVTPTPGYTPTPDFTPGFTPTPDFSTTPVYTPGFTPTPDFSTTPVYTPVVTPTPDFGTTPVFTPTPDFSTTPVVTPTQELTTTGIYVQTPDFTPTSDYSTTPVYTPTPGFTTTPLFETTPIVTPTSPQDIQQNIIYDIQVEVPAQKRTIMEKIIEVVKLLFNCVVRREIF